MKLTTCQSDLDHALRTIAPAVGVRSGHPILDCVLLTAAKGAMTITGFNLDLGISVTCPAAVETDGAIALPYKLLAGLVSRMETGEAISICEDTLSASSGSYGLAAMNASDYPDMPTVTASETSVTFSHGIRACMIAVGKDAAKQILTGIHLANGYMESTDGHRLVRIAVDLPDGIDLVLPAVTMKLLQDRSVGIAAAAGQTVINVGDGVIIYSRMMDGTYPDVAKLIPPTFTTEITLDRHRFTRCLERVAIIAEAHNSIVQLLIGDAGTMVINAEADSNSGTEAIKYEGNANKLALAFNVNYLLDGLKSMRTFEFVVLSLNASTTPVVLKPSDSDSILYLVMPVQVRV